MELLGIQIWRDSEFILKLDLSLLKKKHVKFSAVKEGKENTWHPWLKGRISEWWKSQPDEPNFSRWLSTECRSVITEKYRGCWFSPPPVEFLDEYNSIVLAEIMPYLSIYGWKSFVLRTEHLLIKHLQEKPLCFLSRKGINMHLLNIFKWAHVLIFLSKNSLSWENSQFIFKKACNLYLKTALKYLLWIKMRPSQSIKWEIILLP